MLSLVSSSCFTDEGPTADDTDFKDDFRGEVALIRGIRVIRGQAIMRSKKSLTAGFASRNVAGMRLSGNQNRVHGHAMNLVCLPAPAVALIRWWMPYPDRQEEPN